MEYCDILTPEHPSRLLEVPGIIQRPFQAINASIQVCRRRPVSPKLTCRLLLILILILILLLITDTNANTNTNTSTNHEYESLILTTNTNH